MTVPRTLSALSLFLVLLALPGRAAIPVVSTVAVAGSGGGADGLTGLAADDAGNLYVAGYLNQTGSGSDIFVAKYSPDLVQLATFTYDKAGFSDAAWAVAVDTVVGGVYVAGYVSTAAADSGRDIWIAKFDDGLVLQASVTVNGSAGGWDEARGLRLYDGTLYAVGHSSETGGKAVWAAGYDLDLVLLGSATVVQYGSYGFDILPVASGNIFVAGSRAPNDQTSNDAWIGVFDSSLVMLGSATVAGPAGNNDEYRKLLDDGNGGAVAVGYLNTATAADRFLQHYDGNLVLVSSASFNGPGNSNEYLTDILLTEGGTIVVSGSTSESPAAGGINAVIAEYSTDLVLDSSTTFTSAGSTEDHAYSFLIGANQDVYAAGWVTGATQDAWLARFSTATPALEFPGCAATFNVGPDQAYATIQSAVDAVPATLTGHTCVVIRDDGTYPEQVTVRGFVNNGSSLTITSDPGSGLTPTISPPAGSTAAFVVANASVNVLAVHISPANAIPYGIFVSSAHVKISSVNVKDAGGKIWTAGVAASSWTTVSHASVTAGGANAAALWLPGSVGTSVSYSSAAANGASAYALRLTAASFNTVTDTLLVNLPGAGVHLLNSNGNVISRSSIACDNGGGSAAALYLSNSSSNTVTGTFVRNWFADGVSLNAGSNYNTIAQSTAVLRGSGGQAALSLNNSHSNSVTGCLLNGSAGPAAELASSNYNTISQATMTVADGMGAQGLLLTSASSNTITQSYIANSSDSAVSFLSGASYNSIGQSVVIGGPSANPNPSGIYLFNGSFNTIDQSLVSNPGGHGATFGGSAVRNTISQSTVTSGAAGHSGLNFLSGAGTNTVTGSYVQGSTGAYLSGVKGVLIDASVLSGGPLGPGVYLDGGSSGAIAVSSSVLTGARYGLLIAAQPAALTLSNLTFADLASGATAIRYLGGTFVSTITAASFDASAAINVDASALNGASRVTMKLSTGARAGPVYETDPAALVDWPGAAPAPSTPTAFGAAGVGQRTAAISWSAGANLAGTIYELERSTGTGFGLLQSSTALSFGEATLSAASTYYYRVRALNADFVASAYASTITIVTFPTPVPLTVASVTPSSAAAWGNAALGVVGTGFDGTAVVTLERASAAQGVWTATGAFTNGRFLGTLTKLADGRLLLAGGMFEGSALGKAYADIFDPASGTWTATTAMLQGRNQHAAVLLADGRVLVSGGKGPAGTIINTAEIYDPAAATWTSAGPMASATHGHQMALLADGRVLTAGGDSGSGKVSAAERFDPATNAWTSAGSMSAGRMFPAMTVLNDGRVLVSGDSGGTAASSTAEIYDPAGNSWSAAGSMNSSRYAHQTILLPDGRVLAASGSNGTSVVATADVYDPATGFWTATSTMAAGRLGHALVPVSGGALAVGGQSNSAALASTEIYDIASNSWRAGPALLGVRTYPMAAALDDGRILTAGGRLGYAGSPAAATAEVLVMPVTRITATGVAVGDAQNASGTFDLTAAATGYWDAAVSQSGGRTGRLAGGFLAVSTPAAPSGFAGAAASASAILWTWTDNSGDEAGFRVMSGTLNVSGVLAAGATAWLQTGLGADFLSGPLSVRAFNIAGTADSSTAARTTLAVPPSALTASGVSQTSVTVSWSAGANPAGTLYRLERSTGTGYGLRFAGSATYYYDATLSPSATYYYRALALNGEAVATAYSSTLAVAAAPLPPPPGAAGAPAGTALGTSSISWTWALASGATSHNLFRASDGVYLASSPAAPFVQTGLSPNAAYGLRAAGVNLAGSGPLSAAATAYTAAAPPSGGAAASITSTTLVASWGLNGNPGSTVAQLQRSTDAVVFSTLTAAAVTSYGDADLLGCTTYYYRVRNVNGDGLATAYASFQGVTANTVPDPPSGLSASANAGGTVSLGWGLSPTEGVTGYRLYWDAGSGTVSYAAPLAVLGSTSTAYTTGVLVSSAAYTFALRAAHRCGVTETTGALAMSGAALTVPAVRAVIKEPDSGRRINGDRVTILGELIAGTPSDAQQVRFQYKLAASSVWLDVPAANINHSNPDLEFPYFTHWNVSLLAAGSYDLRAVAYDLAGAPDAAPSAVRVVVDPVNPDISETETVDGKIKKSQTVSNAVTSVVETAGAGAGDPAVRVTIPPGVVNTASATVSVIANPAITTAAPAGQTMVGSAIKIDLSNGQTALSGTAAITLTYPDTVRFPSLLQLYYLDEGTGQWSRDFTTTVDAASRTVTGNTPHFSTFVLMQGTSFASGLDSVQAYPVPYKPNGSNPDEGRPFTHADANSGIIFANLASGSVIKIYTLTGRLVTSLDLPTITGTVRWDARNQDGRDVASGAYFAVISAPGSKSVVKKLVIIR